MQGCQVDNSSTWVACLCLLLVVYCGLEVLGQPEAHDGDASTRRVGAGSPPEAC